MALPLMGRLVQGDPARNGEKHQQYQYLLPLRESIRMVRYQPPRFVCVQTHRQGSLQSLAQYSLTVNEMVASFNNQVKKLDLDLDLSGLSELEITSPDIAPIRTLPLPTVDEHKARVTSINAKPLGSSVPTHSSEEVAYKKPSLVSHIGNRMECVKRGVENRVVGFSSIAVKRFSPVHAPIRLPSSSSEAIG